MHMLWSCLSSSGSISLFFGSAVKITVQWGSNPVCYTWLIFALLMQTLWKFFPVSIESKKCYASCNSFWHRTIMAMLVEGMGVYIHSLATLEAVRYKHVLYCWPMCCFAAVLLGGCYKVVKGPFCINRCVMVTVGSMFFFSNLPSFSYQTCHRLPQ